MIRSRFSSGRIFYGWVRTAPPRWFLWAGFCFFRFDAVKDKSLDFGQDWFVGLDTGGGNWNALYHDADLARFEMAAMRHTPYRAGVALHDAPFQWIGDWLHEVGVWGRDDLKADKRRVLARNHCAALARERKRLAGWLKTPLSSREPRSGLSGTHVPQASLGYVGPGSARCASRSRTRCPG